MDRWKIYGNVYQKDAIAIINPKKWCCRRIINLADLKKKLPNYQIPMQTESLTILKRNHFCDWKNWDKMFEIKISE
jgi:glutamine cyclotransferase